jgi:hypothetical protein
MKKSILLFVVILLIACSGPLSRKYNPETVLQDIVDLNKAVDSTDMLIIGGELIRQQETGLAGKTYGQILEAGKKYEAEQDRLAKEQRELEEKARLEAEQRMNEMRNAVSVALFDKGFAEGDFEEYIRLDYQVINTSGRDIAGLLWELSLIDVLDNELGKYELEMTDPIKAGETINITRYYHYNSFRNEDIKVVGTDLKNLKKYYNPQKIVFADGSKIEL